ncbi:MAG: hypothetical protein GY820_15040 [Gammaproteobacteria bacterium]|nr:hypothetical protein [Gammaproteobacteria bacterium]
MSKTEGSVASLLRERRVVPRLRSPLKAVEYGGYVKAIDDSLNTKAKNWLKKLKVSHEIVPSESTAKEIYQIESIYSCKASDIDSATSAKAHTMFENQIASFLSSGNVGILKESTNHAETDFSLSSYNAQGKIKLLRTRLKNNQDQPFVWSELARSYIAIGQSEKALKAMATARHLAKDNVYICRASARLFIHADMLGRAIHLLRKHPQVSDNPWLISAEIAASSIAERTSPYVKRGMRHVQSTKFSAFQVSELASSIGTLELEHGAIKKAVNLFKLALNNPTENSLAQAQWASEKERKISVSKDALDMPDSFEALTLYHRSRGTYKMSLEACKLWLGDEPFSTRPALTGSYIGILVDDLSAALAFSDAGLAADPRSFSLLNNRAVVHAYRGDVESALSDIKSALFIERAKDDPHLLATLGLLAFRKGELSMGRSLYTESIRWFSLLKSKVSIATAILYWMREENRIGNISINEIEKVGNQVLRSGAISHDPELAELLDVVKQESHQKREADGG